MRKNNMAESFKRIVIFLCIKEVKQSQNLSAEEAI